MLPLFFTFLWNKFVQKVGLKFSFGLTGWKWWSHRLWLNNWIYWTVSNFSEFNGFKQGWTCHASNSGQPKTRLVTPGQGFDPKGYSYPRWQSIKIPWIFYFFSVSIKRLILNKFIKLRFIVTYYFTFPKPTITLSLVHKYNKCTNHLSTQELKYLQ